ncbi:hypothetical protein B0A49_12697, partial [Cryomyces minteri]
EVYALLPRPQERPKREISFVDLATCKAHVSAFCRAVISTVVPDEFWGSTEVKIHNKAVLLRHVDHFVCLRRFESLTLHEVMQDLKITGIPWLRPPGITVTAKTSLPDVSKRREIFAELIYYIFDSLLIPLIRSNFHVTESNIHRNRLFYFRHDVWRTLSEPSLTTLKLSMYEEMQTNQVVKILAARPLGFSQIRLLPKITGSTQPGKLGSSLFSVGDMFPRLREFRKSLQQRGLLGQPLYFAKVDVKSCFDTIPQNSLVALVEELLSVNEYSIIRHAEIKRLHSQQQDQPDKFTTRFVADGQAAGDPEQLIYTDACQVRRNTIFVDLGAPQIQHKRKVLHLLKEHVERNIVKIGKRYYRQKEGIPQGSVLSSLLCSFFYAKLERECLDFVQTEDCLLLRLVDDFLLISVRREHAEDFLQVMHNGVPAYGLAVKAEKSLANFHVEINGRRIESSQGAMQFPYCGNAIHTVSLDISKDRERKQHGSKSSAFSEGTGSEALMRQETSDSLTVDFSKMPGRTFRRKTLS